MAYAKKRRAKKVSTSHKRAKKSAHSRHSKSHAKVNQAAVIKWLEGIFGTKTKKTKAKRSTAAKKHAKSHSRTHAKKKLHTKSRRKAAKYA